MTVKELIDELSQMPMDTKVVTTEYASPEDSVPYVKDITEPMYHKNGILGTHGEPVVDIS
jgi:hypothetical protein